MPSAELPMLKGMKHIGDKTSGSTIADDLNITTYNTTEKFSKSPYTNLIFK